ncbi:hypothetical protein ACLKA7_017066 [Drosophila subpalustris]
MSTTTISVPQSTAADEFHVVCILGVKDNDNTNTSANTSDEGAVVGGGGDSGRASANEFDSVSNEDAASGAVQLRPKNAAAAAEGREMTPTRRSGTKEIVSQTKWYLNPSDENVTTITTTTTMCPDNNVTVTMTAAAAAATTTAAAEATTKAAPTAAPSAQILPKIGKDDVSVIGIRCNGYTECLFSYYLSRRPLTPAPGLSAMKKLIIPNLMDTYGLIKFWDFDAGVPDGSNSHSHSGNKRRPEFGYLASDPMPSERRYKWRARLLQSQQMRAISSPTLSETTTAPQEKPQDELKRTNDADAASAAPVGGSHGLGVLQKFKRTLHNLNLNSRNQLQITPLPGATTTTTTEAVNVDGKTSPTVSITAPPTTTTNGSNETETGGDTSSAKYRFGPLIWRSSKERRKTKFNRRDKCNSGDSGIQIELEQDEQYVRALSGAGAGAGGQQSGGQQSGGIIVRTSTPNTAESKARAIRRTHSAKASSILEQVAGKPPIHKQLDLGSVCSIEREAPESLPTRSLSQPNGLETYGVRRNDVEDSDSDSVASHEEANSSYYPIYAEVLYNFTAAGPQELGLERGNLIEILRKEVGPWWFGCVKKEDLVEDKFHHELGWFPKDFVRIIHSPETDAFYNLQKSTLQREEDDEEEPISQAAVDVDINVNANVDVHVVDDNQMPVPVVDLNSSSEEANSTMTMMDQSNITTIVIESPPPTTNNARISVPLDNCDILRRSAVRELLETEVNYVKLLAAICEGYLPAMSKRIDIFSPNSIRLIFSNITAIYKFQRKFLEALRIGIEQNQLSKVFLKMHKGFLCYSTYCNAYPRALIELESYDRIKDARIILENCRESENLAELPLSAHLLAPVQRICRYPLHLNEIIKTALSSNSTSATDQVDGQTTEALDYEQLDVFQLDVPDTHDIVNLALGKMRGITEAVNEGKRHSETIARHQASFQNFKGPPLHLHSTRFFLQVDATRQKQNLWNTSCTLFLFDNQLIYCKRDIIKRSHFIYKGRIFLDRCRVVNVRDGKMFGHTIKNSLRIHCESRDKWYDFSFRSANRKHRFLNTLALERQFGGKAMYVQEMAGFEYNYDERPGDYSDQSDYELPDCEHALGGGTSASGDSSVPDSPAKSPYRSCDTLPKKSQSRDGIASASNGSAAQALSTTSTGSLGRRRIGNWFRKPKSTNCTPSQSPTHKPGFDADVTLTAARVAAIELVEAAAAQQQQEVDSSFA